MAKLIKKMSKTIDFTLGIVVRKECFLSAFAENHGCLAVPACRQAGMNVERDDCFGGFRLDWRSAG